MVSFPAASADSTGPAGLRPVEPPGISGAGIFAAGVAVAGASTVALALLPESARLTIGAAGLLTATAAFLIGLVRLAGAAGGDTGALRRAVDGASAGTLLLLVYWLLPPTGWGSPVGAGFALATFATLGIVTGRALRTTTGPRIVLAWSASGMITLLAIAVLVVPLVRGEREPALMVTAVGLVLGPPLTVAAVRHAGALTPARPTGVAPVSSPLLVVPIWVASMMAAHHLAAVGGLDRTSLTIALIAAALVAVRQTADAAHARRYAHLLAAGPSRSPSLPSPPLPSPSPPSPPTPADAPRRVPGPRPGGPADRANEAMPVNRTSPGRRGALLRAGSVRRRELERELPGAIRRGELDLAFQPVVGLLDRRPVGAEALLRWRHWQLGDVPPLELLPVAHDLGIAAEIAQWVLDRSCRQLACWRRDGRTLGLSVNLSRGQLAAPGFVDRVGAVLEAYGVPADQLTVEVGEVALEADPDSVVTRLDQLRGFGVRTALDDFGAGSASLAMLRSLPVDVIKIDCKLVAGSAVQSGSSRPSAAVVMALSRRLGIELAAERVESRTCLAEAVASGCRLGQGFLLAAPMTAEHLEAYLDGYRIPSVRSAGGRGASR